LTTRKGPPRAPTANADLQAAAARSQALAMLVEDTLGTELNLVSGLIEGQRLVFAELWSHRGASASALVPLIGASLADDALLAARRSLLEADFLGLYSDLRRSFEMQMLALAAFHEPRIADKWVAGGAIQPKDLRRVVGENEPEGKVVIDHLYRLLSESAHGRVESMAAYGNRWERFEWPVRPETVDPDAIRRAFRALAEMAWNLANVEERVTDTWRLVEDDALRNFAKAQYGLVASYAKHHLPVGHTRWVKVKADSALEWLSLPAIPGGKANPRN
jgi:hypothetical protein